MATAKSLKRKTTHDDRPVSEAALLNGNGNAIDMASDSEDEDFVPAASDDEDEDEFPEIDTRSDSDDEDTPDEDEDAGDASSSSETLHVGPVGKTIISDITGRPKTVYPEIDPDYDSDSSTEDVRVILASVFQVLTARRTQIASGTCPCTGTTICLTLATIWKGKRSSRLQRATSSTNSLRQ